MTDDDRTTPPRRLELSSTQVAGSALAAVSAAFFASWLGTAGTLIGAAVGSIVATVGSATYTWWLRRTSEVVRRTAAQVRETGMGSTVVVPGLRTRRVRAVDPEEVVDPDEQEDPDRADRWAFLRGRPWGKVALVAAGVMLAALASITVVEALTGKTISGITRGDDSKGTTVERLVGKHGGASPTRQPTHTPTPAPTSSRPSSAPPTPAPTVVPSAPATPTPGSTEAPTTPPATPEPSQPTPVP